MLFKEIQEIAIINVSIILNLNHLKCNLPN